jgi:hypothetical protein
MTDAPERIILQALGLLRSMIECGEQFTPTSLDAYMKALIAIEKFPRWVSVKERLPKTTGWYHVADGSGNIGIEFFQLGSFDGGGWMYWLSDVPPLPNQGG